MPSNAEAAEIFRNIADLLDVLGEKFKPEAYRRASRSIETLPEDLGKFAARDELRAIPGVGEAIAEKIREYLTTGQVSYYERLRREVPPGLVELMHLPGLGPKTARRFWTDLGVEGPAELEGAIAQGRLDSVKGFGPKKIEQVRTALAQARTAPASGTARVPIESAYPVAERIVRALRGRARNDVVEVAGSFRRRRETVGDLDILVTSEEPERVFDTFSALPEVREVRLRGGTKETVLLTNGLQVDLRVVEPASFGAALQYFTGSKDHNVHLRTIARDRGLKINEYGVFRGEELIGGRTEEEVYGTLGLPWIPPELREDRGEVEAAARGVVPSLVRAEDLTGELHLHLPSTATASDVTHLLRDARTRGLSYLGVVVAGVASDGNPFSLPAATLAALEAGRKDGLELGRALESGPGPLPPALRGVSAEYRIVRATASEPELSAVEAGGPPPFLVAHLGSAGGGAGSWRGWVEWARATDSAVEVGPGPERLDSTAARLARESEVPLAVPTGVGAPPDDPTAPIALGFARRAGAGPTDVCVRGPSGRPVALRSTGSR
ncbi:MAG: helix-hairpin-helix domain-containing protein [Thermoplasmata archaeon]|jgi:DNA polymerase/3'-5' exonuclease PolX